MASGVRLEGSAGTSGVDGLQSFSIHVFIGPVNVGETESFLHTNFPIDLLAFPAAVPPLLPPPPAFFLF